MNNFFKINKDKMNLPNSRYKNQQGQILIIFLLVLVVGVAIVLSLASRTLTDEKSTSTADESNRAYFAAEAGVESALKKISGTSGSFNFSLDFSSVNQTKAVVNAQEYQSEDGLFAFPEPVLRDDVVQVVLLDDFNQIDTSGDYAASQLDIFWGNDGGGAPPPPGSYPALLVSLVYRDAANNFQVVKWAFDPDSVRSGSNNFCFNEIEAINPGAEAAVNLDNASRDFQYRARINLRTGTYRDNTAARCINSAITPAIAVPAKLVLVRIKPLYNATGHIIGVKPVGANLPNQGFVVESTGSTVGGVTRKLKVIQPYPALPSIFDFVLFNGSNNPLIK